MMIILSFAYLFSVFQIILDNEIFLINICLNHFYMNHKWLLNQKMKNILKNKN
jgi:hypothetical protein